RKNKIGFVFQSCNLISHLSILDNVTIALRLSNINREERRKRAISALKEVGLIDHLNKKPNELSGGQRQRVAIARALINNPEIIVADEPTGALDQETTEHVLDIIRGIAKRGKLVILVTHSDLVASYSNRIIKLKDGKIIEDSKNRETFILKNTEKWSEENKGNLSFMSAIKISEKNMKEKLSRNILMLFGVSIGIMSIILMLGLGNGLKSYFSSIIYQYMNPLIVEVNMKTDDDPTKMVMSVMGAGKNFEENDIKLLSSLKNVVGTEKGFSMVSIGSAFLKFNDDESMILMVNSMSKSITEENIIEGRRPEKNEILISERILDDLSVETSEIIDEDVSVELILGTSFIESDFKVSGIFSSDAGAPSEETTIIYVNYDDLKEIAKEYNYDLEPTKMYLEADSESNAVHIKKLIKDLGYEGSPQEIMGEKLLTMLKLMTYVLAGIAAISLVVSAIMIIVVLRISVSERTKEIGLLRAIGARSKDIRRIFISESILIGVGSGILGILVSFLLSYIINPIVYRHFYIDVLVIKASYLLLGIAVSIVICAAAGLIPAVKAAKLDPVDSLRSE
ncbi:MAG: ATP-binding cassette domain-containing protein, partial [Clostridium sp.]|nr:ATP-binding cassette domain-containing protein [Clostridium sp.]